jgi:hypothetical protein
MLASLQEGSKNAGKEFVDSVCVLVIYAVGQATQPRRVYFGDISTTAKETQSRQVFFE